MQRYPLENCNDFISSESQELYTILYLHNQCKEVCYEFLLQVQSHRSLPSIQSYYYYCYYYYYYYYCHYYYCNCYYITPLYSQALSHDGKTRFYACIIIPKRVNTKCSWLTTLPFTYSFAQTPYKISISSSLHTQKQDLIHPCFLSLLLTLLNSHGLIFKVILFLLIPYIHPMIYILFSSF